MRILWFKYFGIRFHLMALLSSLITANAITYFLNVLGKYPDKGNIWIVLLISISYYLFNLFLLIRGFILTYLILAK